jgi:cleavage and polyadenylation specificity factor subunit 1
MADVDVRIKNIIDYAFIPGFNNPTLAIAFQTTPTWTAYVPPTYRLTLISLFPRRLNELKDTVSIFLITIDAVTRSYPVISQIHGMPYDVQYIIPCPASLGGLLLVTSNAILHTDQSSRTVGVAVSGWANRTSALHFPLQHDEYSGEPLDLKLEGSRLSFVKEEANSVIVVLADGTVRKLTLHTEGRLVSRLELSSIIGQTMPAATLSVHNASLIFVGSTAGPSTLLKVAHVEQVVERKQEAVPMVEDDADIELDEGTTDLTSVTLFSIGPAKHHRNLW